MKKNNNNWREFSRGIATIILIIAIIFGFCGLGAAFANIPWFFIAGAICLLLIAGTAIWFLGYKSRQAQPIEQPVQTPVEMPVQTPVEMPVQTPVEMPVQMPVEQPAEEVIILRRRLTPEEFNKAYNMFAETPANEETPSIEEVLHNLSGE